MTPEQVRIVMNGVATLEMQMVAMQAQLHSVKAGLEVLFPGGMEFFREKMPEKPAEPVVPVPEKPRHYGVRRTG